MKKSELTSSDNNVVFLTFAAAAVAALVLRGMFFLRPGVFTSSIIGLSGCKPNNNFHSKEPELTLALDRRECVLDNHRER